MESAPVMGKIKVSQAPLYVKCTWCGEEAVLEVLEKDGASYKCMNCSRSFRIVMGDG